MKKITITFSFKQLIIGLFAIICVGSLTAFMSSGNSNAFLEDPISATTAHTYYQAYANENPDGVKYLSITSDQYLAMRRLKKSSTAGFRIYFGSNAENKVSMICTVDGEGNDDTGVIEYVTQVSLFRGCPEACDNQSPIVTGE